MGKSSLAAIAAFGLWIAIVAPSRLAAARGESAACIPADQCCRICDRGQACGKSCISADKTCHKGRGCACNASEVCP